MASTLSAGEASVSAPLPGEEPGRLVLLTHPLVGFPRSTRFTIRALGDAYGLYCVMTSLDEVGLSFVVVPPGVLFGDYRFELGDDDVARLGLIDASDVETWVLITRKGVPVPTANLLGPIIINRRSRIGAQVVLQDSDYDVAVPVDSRSAHSN